jgi:preprotein translocase subunit SecG
MTLELIFGISLMVLATVVAVLVLLQTGKEKSLSGTIAGAGESFYSKNKGKSKGKTLSIITTILSIVFVILAIAFVVVIGVNAK